MRRVALALFAVPLLLGLAVATGDRDRFQVSLRSFTQGSQELGWGGKKNKKTSHTSAAAQTAAMNRGCQPKGWTPCSIGGISLSGRPIEVVQGGKKFCCPKPREKKTPDKKKTGKPERIREPLKDAKQKAADAANQAAEKEAKEKTQANSKVSETDHKKKVKEREQANRMEKREATKKAEKDAAKAKEATEWATKKAAAENARKEEGEKSRRAQRIKGNENVEASKSKEEIRAEVRAEAIELFKKHNQPGKAKIVDRILNNPKYKNDPRKMIVAIKMKYARKDAENRKKNKAKEAKKTAKKAAKKAEKKATKEAPKEAPKKAPKKLISGGTEDSREATKAEDCQPGRAGPAGCPNLAASLRKSIAKDSGPSKTSNPARDRNYDDGKP